MNYDELGQITIPLLDWYRANKRRLPWRESREPYRVWVSEIMLQQTRVEAVIPYYRRFMERFPTIASLAACGDEELYKMWEGLGYYSRARNLRKAAQVICAQYQGNFPKEYDKILALPGIGAYTAGAVASIAFGQPRAAVDGNVLRVVTRLTQDGHDITDAKFRSLVTERLEGIYPPEGQGDFTQSLMELGAVVCVPNGAPECVRCPLSYLCGAYGSGTQRQYPVKKKKPARKIEEKTVLVLSCRGKVAIRKRAKQGILAGMWELPNMDGTLGEQEICAWLARRACGGETPVRAGRQLKHIFTHVEWHMACWFVNCANEGDDAGITWATAAQLKDAFALPTAFRKVYQYYQLSCVN